MATFQVDVGGATYEVDASDENTAWKWANKTHSQSSSPSASKTKKTKDDFQREVLAEMPWAQRQMVGVGGALMKGYEGIRSMIPGQTSDQDIVKAANVAGQEAPLGSMLGEIVKYAPVGLAGTAVLPVAGASAALGALYDPTGHRLSSAALEGLFGAGGALIGKALPRVAGGVKNIYNKGRSVVSGVPTDRFYGAADKASEAAKKIISDDNIAAASKMLGDAGDVSTAQALAGLPNYGGGIPVLDKITRSDKGIQAAVDPIFAASERTGQVARQSQAQNEIMERMARGSTAEDTAIARDLFSKMSAKELVPIRDSILNKLKQTGLTIDEIIPQLQGLERQYVSALRGGMPANIPANPTETLVRGAMTGRPVVGQATVHPSTEAAQSIVRNQRGDSGWLSNANRAVEWRGAADELGDISKGLRIEADALRKQISELPAAFTAAPVRDAVASAAAKTVNPTEETVMKAVSKALQRAGDDPVAIAEVRKLGVNQIMGDLIDSGKLSKTDAAAALGKVKALIDKQLGPEFVTRYMEPYSKKLEYRASLELADTLRQLQKDNPKEFLKVMQGNNPELVAKYGNWDTIKQALGEKRFSRASKVAGEIQRDINIKGAAESTEYGAAVKEVLENKSLTRHFPNLLNRYVALSNAAIDRGEMEVNKLMYRELEQAMRNPSKMKALIDRLPPEERSKMINYAMKLGKGAPTTSAAYGEQVRK